MMMMMAQSPSILLFVFMHVCRPLEANADVWWCVSFTLYDTTVYFVSKIVSSYRQFFKIDSSFCFRLLLSDELALNQHDIDYWTTCPMSRSVSTKACKARPRKKLIALATMHWNITWFQLFAFSFYREFYLWTRSVTVTGANVTVRKVVESHSWLSLSLLLL